MYVLVILDRDNNTKVVGSFHKRNKAWSYKDRLETGPNKFDYKRITIHKTQSPDPDVTKGVFY